MSRDTYYYALVDTNGVLCVDEVDDYPDVPTEHHVARLAESYPEAIYFLVNNAVPEFRVPRD